MGQNGTNASVDVCKTLDVASATPVVCLSNGQANAEQTENYSPALTCIHDGPPIVCQASNNEDVIGALCARDHKGVGNEFVDEGKVILQPVVLKLRHTGTPNVGGGEGAMWGEDVSYTLATHQDQTLFAPENNGYIVRRLTPTECERLQGFPDGWTDIPYRGKEHPADGPRYKALGNSMCVNVMRWIGERIEIVDEMLKEVETND